ncbi:MAG: ABC transporter permease [Pseudomonadota bacterium]|nr:ABC transporter permease [Pseudomonadota bacterium]
MAVPGRRRALSPRALPAALGLLVALAIWAVAASRWPPHVLPGPLVVLETIVTQRSELVGHALRTTRRVLLGYGAAVVIGLPLAMALGARPVLDRQVGALLTLLRSIPPFAWTPLILLWVGVGDGSAAAVVFAGAFFPIVRNARAGIDAVPPSLVLAARNLGAGPRVYWLDVVLPGAAPMVFTGLRLGWALAWMSVVAAELVGADGGLGQLILDARNLARPDLAIAGMVAIGALAAGSERGFALVERRVLRWRA